MATDVLGLMFSDIILLRKGAVLPWASLAAIPELRLLNG
jgi:hypothetical protein